MNCIEGNGARLVEDSLKTAVKLYFAKIFCDDLFFLSLTCKMIDW